MAPGFDAHPVEDSIPTDPIPTGLRRACFVCGGSSGSIHQDETWSVLGLGEIRKGFRVCTGCGLVLQDPVVPQASMEWFYAHLSNYTNPMAGGEPTERKVAAVEAQLDFLGPALSPGARIFQVGSSDGYTLSRFRARDCDVLGCDPSANAASVAERLWSVPTRVMPFEGYAFGSDEQYDWIVLTHVLEHLYDPVETLERCAAGLSPGGRLLVEVPLLGHPEYLPPGYFQFEHINYFTLASLRNTLAVAGFEIVGEIEVDLEGDHYPVQRLIAQRTAQRSIIASTREINETEALVRSYVEAETSVWQGFARTIRERVGSGRPVYVWGAGIHTSILFGRTAIDRAVDVRSLVDSDPQKWTQRLGGIPVMDPESMLAERGDAPIVISTLAGEPAIRSLLLNRGVPERDIIALYDSMRGPRAAPPDVAAPSHSSPQP